MHPLANALIVVDVQRDFCPGGSLAVEHGDEVATRIHTFIEEHNDEYKVIVATKDWHPNHDEVRFDHFSDEPDYKDTWPPHCQAGTPGANFHPNLGAIDPTAVSDGGYYMSAMPQIQFDRIFYKGQNSAAYSGFEGVAGTELLLGKDEISVFEDLNMYLKTHGIGHVDICGLATDYCVAATARDAIFQGYDTSVLIAMCAGVNRETSIQSIKDLLTMGVHVDGWWG